VNHYWGLDLLFFLMAFNFKVIVEIIRFYCFDEPTSSAIISTAVQ